MAKIHPEISEDLKKFIEAQHIFFVGTAMEDGKVNVSPKGRDSMRVIGPNKILWRNLTGSGNETAAHIKKVNRITLMWCAFEGKPMILRCYGTAKAYHERDTEWEELNGMFPHSNGARQVYEIEVETVQTSCGYSIPFMDFKEDRDVLEKWTENKGRDGIRDYWKEKNTKSFDGAETGIFE
ncbi:pyridoxamine 5'-phosphate oxidase family protein [Arcticibacterium luteifluviistationis]|uniref:Pyridoxamine 5'-phosphate oxidase n=1 Tax=Arcticibacterium luteifluviistationis TaxID=1784714 RepID=A0A2Z4G791_9BACT|nr:pyridoxamine 5'-phosphate oxidase family protein [Arcticibacterium luteifluviistationis]AWV97019.1 pyridoxamine 5'-phosphate oxidase [Arcticibacterium luteifluviistationis]